MQFSYQHKISDVLWEAIQKRYIAEDYTGAILDSIFLVSDTLRNRCDVELDGVALIGKVFGGNNPLLKINKLRTESEKSEQKGVESVLRGVFQSIRNPRAHEKFKDSKKTCDMFIVFIDYYLEIIEKSKSKFDLDDFCLRVFDDDFVESKKYADILASEIPEKKRLDVLLEIIERRENASPEKYSYIFQSIFSTLNDEEKKNIKDSVSEILKITTNKHDLNPVCNLFRSK